jgi:membrane protein YqaA with SNARE-associated domain
VTTAAEPRVQTGDRLAFGWGFGEAVLFFVIPDVFLTLVAIRLGFRRSIRLAVLATTGAVLGGLVVYAWAALHPASGAAVMQLLPGIDAAMIDGVAADVAANGNAALLAGPWQGRPYKLFALASGDLGLSPVGLALITIPGRFARFAAAVAIASYLRRFFARWLTQGTILVSWAGFWLLVYAAYWFGLSR